MKRIYLIIIGIAIIGMVLFKGGNLLHSKQTMLPPSDIPQTMQQAKIIGNHGVINYSSGKTEILLYFDPTKVIGCTDENSIPITSYAELSEGIVENWRNLRSMSLRMVYGTYQGIAGEFYTYTVYDQQRKLYMDVVFMVDDTEYHFMKPPNIVSPIVLNYPLLTDKTRVILKLWYYDNFGNKKIVRNHSIWLSAYIEQPLVYMESLTDHEVQFKIVTKEPTNKCRIYIDVKKKDGTLVETKFVDAIQDNSVYFIDFTNLESNTEYKAEVYMADDFISKFGEPVNPYFFHVAYGEEDNVPPKTFTFTTLSHTDPIKITPLTTEITDNSFVQTFSVNREDPQIKVTLYYDGQSKKGTYQYDGEKYLTVFSSLKPATTYRYTITAYEKGDKDKFDTYTNEFKTPEKIQTETKVTIEESYLKDDQFYMKFTIDGDYSKYEFLYKKEGGKVRKVRIEDFGYFTLTTPKLRVGNYEWKLLITTPEGVIVKTGTFQIQGAVPSSYTDTDGGEIHINSFFVIIGIILVSVYLAYTQLRRSGKK